MKEEGQPQSVQVDRVPVLDSHLDRLQVGVHCHIYTSDRSMHLVINNMHHIATMDSHSDECLFDVDINSNDVLQTRRTVST